MLSLSVLRLRGDKSLESSAIASHHPATLSRPHNPTVLVAVVFCDIQILNALYSAVFDLSIVFLKFFSVFLFSLQSGPIQSITDMNKNPEINKPHKKQGGTSPSL